MGRRFDHIVLAARDLGAQADAFRHMGFRVGARNMHPWGTQNHVIQFADSFLELICAPEPFHAPVDPDPRAFSMAAFIHGFTQTGEGGAMIALRADDPDADSHRFRELEMGDYEPFHFERRGKRADGSQTHVAFTLAFAHAHTLPGVGFFTSRHEKPENFWDKDLQDHANGAAGVSKVTIVAENPADHAEFLSHFTQVRAFHSSSMGVEFLLGEGQKIEVLTPLAFEFHHGPRDWNEGDAPHIGAVELRTNSIPAVVEALTCGRVEHAERNGRILVPPSAAFGVTLAFAP